MLRCSRPVPSVGKAVPGTNREHLLQLQTVLEAHQDLWRPAPFHVRRPPWCARRPDLAHAALDLDEPTVEALSSKPEASHTWLAQHLPIVETFSRLTRVPALPARQLPATSARFDWAIPGRKRAQIEAFAGATPIARTPLLEWCAGKGHLGRRLALSDRVPVRALENDPALCEHVGRLATRARVEQTVLCADALQVTAHTHVRDHTVLALHACGELHRSLVRQAARDGAYGYRIAPCCYHLGVTDTYRALSSVAALPLDSDTLRLATTETVTAPHHVRRRLARDQAWKLGFIALRNELEGERHRSFRSVPTRWLSDDFPTFCRSLAQREGVSLPVVVDWEHWLAAGELRRREVRRLELIRHAFRRPLEVWLVMDLAVGLEDAGFDVRVGSFCDRSVTPRNLMLLAQR